MNATPKIVKPGNSLKPPPPVPSHYDLRDLYYERKANITNARSALPSIVVPYDLRKVPDPRMM